MNTTPATTPTKSAASTSSVYHLPDSGLYFDIQSVRVQPVIELITDIGSFKLTLPVSESFSPTIQSANYDGKKKRERRADFGRTKNWKKAFVRLADGETIEFV